METKTSWTADNCPDANGATTIRVDDGTVSGNLDAQPIATVYDEANARLIAAAPDMAELLERIANWERTFDDPGARNVCTKIDALLNKIKGDQNVQ